MRLAYLFLALALMAGNCVTAQTVINASGQCNGQFPTTETCAEKYSVFTLACPTDCNAAGTVCQDPGEDPLEVWYEVPNPSAVIEYYSPAPVNDLGVSVILDGQAICQQDGVCRCEPETSGFVCVKLAADNINVVNFYSVDTICISSGI